MLGTLPADALFLSGFAHRPPGRQMICRLPLAPFDFDAHPLFNGGVTWGRFKVTAEFQEFAVRGDQRLPLIVRVELGEGAQQATELQASFLSSLIFHEQCP